MLAFLLQLYSLKKYKPLSHHQNRSKKAILCRYKHKLKLHSIGGNMAGTLYLGERVCRLTSVNIFWYIENEMYWSYMIWIRLNMCWYVLYTCCKILIPSCKGCSEDEKRRGVFIIVTFVVSLVSFARRPINRHVARTVRKNGS